MQARETPAPTSEMRRTTHRSRRQARRIDWHIAAWCSNSAAPREGRFRGCLVGGHNKPAGQLAAEPGIELNAWDENAAAHAHAGQRAVPDGLLYQPSADAEQLSGFGDAQGGAVSRTHDSPRSVWVMGCRRGHASESPRGAAGTRARLRDGLGAAPLDDLARLRMRICLGPRSEVTSPQPRPQW